MFDNLIFESPRLLWLLLIIPVGALAYYWFWNKSYPEVRIPTLEGFQVKSATLNRLRVLKPFLRLLALAFIILGFARPQQVDMTTRSFTSSGIDIVMAIDVSSSMLAQDLKPNRLAALKEVATSFIAERVNDRIGLVVYAGESYTKTPVTSDKNIIGNALNSINYDFSIEDGTAIGMGLATAVNRLKESEATSKVIILLTDGVNNSGFIDPMIAVELAKEFSIRTYTIGLGSNGNAMAPVGILPNGRFQYGLTEVEIDEELLTEIAQSTGGQYFRATDNQKLEEVYQEINTLEKTEIEEFRYFNYKELFRPFVLCGLVLLLLEWLLANTLFRSFI